MSDFAEISARFQALSQKWQAGQVTPEQYQQELDQLQCQDQQGVWWRIQGPDGHWIRYDGKQWVPATPPTQASTAVTEKRTAVTDPQGAVSPTDQTAGGVPSKKAKPEKAKTPETLMQLFGLIIKSLPKAMFSGLAFRLFLGLGIAFMIWLVHTILLIGPNGGFNSDNAFLNHILALGGWKFFGGTMFWTMGVFLLTTLIYKAKHPGLGPFFSGVLSAPGQMFKAFGAAGTRSLGLLACGGALGIAVGSLANSAFVGAQMAFAVAMSIAAGSQSLLLFSTALGWSDGQRWFRGKKPAIGYSQQYGLVFLAGLFSGFLVSMVVTILPFQPWSSCGMIFSAGALAVLLALVSKGSKSPVVPQLLVLLSTSLITLSLYADDGGWEEAGGSLTTWIGSDGSIIAVMVGLGPALGGLGGFLAGTLFGGGLPFDMNLPKPGVPAGTTPVLPEGGVGAETSVPGDGAGTLPGGVGGAGSKTHNPFDWFTGDQAGEIGAIGAGFTSLMDGIGGHLNDFNKQISKLDRVKNLHKNVLKNNIIKGKGGQISFKDPGKVDKVRKLHNSINKSAKSAGGRLTQFLNKIKKATSGGWMDKAKNFGKGALKAVDRVLKVGNALQVGYQSHKEGSNIVVAIFKGGVSTLVGHVLTDNPYSAGYEISMAASGNGSQYGIQSNVNDVILHPVKYLSNAASGVKNSIVKAGGAIKSTLGGIKNSISSWFK